MSQTIGICLVSHGDSVKFSLLIDKAVTDSPDKLMDLFEEKFEEIFDL